MCTNLLAQMRFQPGNLGNLQTAHKIAPSVSDLFSKLLRLGSLLIQWKLANIVPVCNKENKEYVENYQLLCLASKVMERCLFVAIKDQV